MVLSIFLETALVLLTLTEEPETNFNDLGKLLLGGVVATIVFALVFSFVRLKLRDKRPAKSSFTTIGGINDRE